MGSRLRSAAADTLAGCAAALAMSAVMLAGQRAGRQLKSAAAHVVYGRTLSSLTESLER